MQPKFGEYHEGYGSELLCPFCGSNYLHHDRIEAFEREEDQKLGLHVSIADGKVKADTDLKSNPSARRHALNIHFLCEGCSEKSVLSISQHKGNTHINSN